MLTQRLSRITIPAILLLAFALRVFYLNERGLWYDEAFSVFLSKQNYASILLGTAADVQPPVYYFLLHLWMQLAGDSAFAARFYSVFFGVATVPILFCLARDLFGRRVGIAAALVVAIAPFHLAYSQEARMYSQLGFWSALAFLAFVRCWRSERKFWWVVFVVAGAGALYSHNLAIVSLGALGIWTIIDAVRARTSRLLRAMILAGAAMFALWLPWLIFVPSQFGKIEQAYWVPIPTLVTLFQTLIVFTFDFDNAAAPSKLLPILLFGAILLPVIFALEIWRRGRRESRVPIVLVATMAILPIGLLFVVSQWRPVYVTRALMPVFLWYAIGIAWIFVGMSRLPQRILAAAFGAIVIAVLPAYYTYAEFPRSPFQQADAMLRAQIKPGDAIVHDNKMSFFPMHYYDGTLAQSFLPDPAGAGSDTLAVPTQQALNLFATPIDAAVAGKSRVWFVIFQEALDQAASEGHTQGNLSQLDAVMQRSEILQIGDLRIYRYDHR